jgi:hypothetical protein
MSRFIRSALAAVTAMICAAHATPAAAQEYLFSGAADVATGAEGGGHGHAHGVRRAPTTFHLGGEAKIDESPENVLAAYLVLEIEPHADAGIGARYYRFATDRLGFYVDGTGLFAPAQLFGAGGGLEYRQPMGKRTSLTLGPSMNVFFAGSDLPKDVVVWQGLFHVGFHVDFH